MRIVPSRRGFLRSLALAPVTARLTAAQSRPNIVYILADDLGYGDPRCYNPQSKVPTPNLDRLASQGMRFTDAHSGSAVCTPTRYGINTGRYCWRSSLKSGVCRGTPRPCSSRAAHRTRDAEKAGISDRRHRQMAPGLAKSPGDGLFPAASARAARRRIRLLFRHSGVARYAALPVLRK